ncbi:MAG TPA: CheR family methyltransferase [Gammaproteobacteria bacterium]
MSLDRLKQILKREIGLDASTVGEATIKKILNQRMHSCQIQNTEKYYQFLANNSEELLALLETAVIPETWFFRDSKPFEIILNNIQKRLLTHPKEKCNILSIPCSTGEEPYSIAMYLLHHGIPAANFDIHACDISQQALNIAREGYYTQNSFRGKIEQKFLDQFFHVEDKQYTIQSQVKQQVSFSRINILDPQQIPFNQFFDFILCRNLLIYFDSNGKSNAFVHMHKMLKDDGVLFIGHSEYGAVPQNLFRTTAINNAFGLLKLEYWKQNNHTTDQHRPANKEAPTPQRAFASFTAETPDNSNIHQNTDHKDTSLLDKAQSLADKGILDEAEQLCLQHIEQQGDSSDSFYLLGLIHQASNNIQTAESLFRKAIYLNPKHHEALIHLALILEQSGDTKSAQLFKQRADRALAG